ncbi:retinol dehydrogenase 12-like protein [Leptotrombidium deliense]|uniref:Retinol dehydrogenase 12-like protein n=1 Tax=Leptotrombidium deliense TaxID=299467 RepID=A0A443SPQ3_9ACAR|nr:retinol dehydrogenase 12-like protein [Leptotrombidium deliense]
MFMFLVNSGAIVIGSVALIRLYLNKSFKKCDSKQRLDGKTVLITGGNSGIGKQTAALLLQRGAKVILACRDADSATRAIDEINRNRTDEFGSAIFKQLDLNSFESVKRLVEDSPSRVVFVSSILYKYGDIRDIDLQPDQLNPGNYDIDKAYANSKLASVLYFRKLSKQMEKKKIAVKMFCVSPGLVFTNIGRHMKLIWKILLLPFAFLFLRTPKQGSQTTMYCVLEATENGAYYRNCEKIPFAGKANDDNLASLVYDRTLAAIKAHCNTNY